MVWLMTLRSIGTIALGLVFGGAGAIGVTRLLDHLLYGVTSTDPLTFVMCLSLLASVAVLASYVPARAAARVNPVDALRSE